MEMEKVIEAWKDKYSVCSKYIMLIFINNILVQINFSSFNKVNIIDKYKKQVLQ